METVLEKKLRSFAYHHGKNTMTVFNDLLDYIIGYFDMTGKPVEGWKYKAEQNAEFHDMMREYILLMNDRLKTREWHDAWGDTFMAMQTAGGGKGQFFTPEDLCEMMAETTIPNKEDLESRCNSDTKFGKRVSVSDCAAGSGRCLLAAHARILKLSGRKPFLSAEDIDLTCCKMTAINFAVHGCFGEVVCHNALTEPETMRAGFIINESMWPLPCQIPSIRRTNDPREFYGLQIWQKRKQEQKEQPQQPPQAEVGQLTLF